MDKLLQLREAAVALMQRGGTQQKIGDVQIGTWKDDRLTIVVRTPFARSPGSLPYGLEISASEKVLNLEWNQGELAVLAYRRGDWEEYLLDLVEQ